MRMLIACVAVLCLGLVALRADADPGAGPRQVLNVGNSYLQYNGGVWNHARRMAAEGLGLSEQALQHDGAVILGGRLAEHPVERYLARGGDRPDGA